jgi:hypothetical protein
MTSKTAGQFDGNFLEKGFKVRIKNEGLKIKNEG